MSKKPFPFEVCKLCCTGDSGGGGGQDAVGVPLITSPDASGNILKLTEFENGVYVLEGKFFASEGRRGKNYLEFENDIVRIENNGGECSLSRHILEDNIVENYSFTATSDYIYTTIPQSVIVDETYDAESLDAQSGIAVAEAVATAANAIKGNVTGGDEVNVTDASPLVHNMDITATRKNLFNFVEGTKITTNAKIYCPNVAAPFTLTAQVTMTNNPSNLSSNFIRVWYTDNTYNDTSLTNISYVTNLGDKKYLIVMSITNTTKILNYIEVKNYNYVAGTFDFIQVEKGKVTAADFVYSPYIENIEDVSIYGIKTKDVIGKNLLIPEALNTRTINGVTCTVSEDGTIYLNGTATINTSIVIGTADVQSGGTYTLSGAPIEYKDNQYVYLEAMYGIADASNAYHAEDFGEGATFNASTDYECLVILWIFGGTVLENVAIKPQIEEGTKTEYEPYIDTEYFALDAEGKASVPSKYPNIKSDTSGVMLECKYNRDTNAVIEELANAIIALGGSL